MNKLSFLFILSFSILGLIPSCVLATSNVIAPTEVNVKFIPEIPGPNEYVEVTLESFGTNLDADRISWYINGDLIKSGTGLKFFSFTTGKTNTSTILDIKIVTKTGENINKTFNLKPSNVDIIWQAYGYTPPFFKGKTLFSHQNKIKFIAVPHITNSSGETISSNELIYKWKRNGNVITDFSGYGKSTYTLVGSIISRPLEIEVEISSQNSESIAKGFVRVDPIDPVLVFYEKNPLYGIRFQKSINDEVVISGSNEIEIIAQPFYAGVTSLSDKYLTYNWMVNGTRVEENTSASRVFKVKEGTFGVSKISLSVENASEILQYATKSFNLRFDDTNNSL